MRAQVLKIPLQDSFEYPVQLIASLQSSPVGRTIFVVTGTCPPVGLLGDIGGRVPVGPGVGVLIAVGVVETVTCDGTGGLFGSRSCAG